MRPLNLNSPVAGTKPEGQWRKLIKNPKVCHSSFYFSSSDGYTFRQFRCACPPGFRKFMALESRYVREAPDQPANVATRPDQTRPDGSSSRSCCWSAFSVLKHGNLRFFGGGGSSSQQVRGFYVLLYAWFSGASQHFPVTGCSTRSQCQCQRTRATTLWIRKEWK